MPHNHVYIDGHFHGFSLLTRYLYCTAVEASFSEINQISFTVSESEGNFTGCIVLSGAVLDRDVQVMVTPVNGTATGSYMRTYIRS